MEGGVRNCKMMAFWDIYPKKGINNYPIIRLRCPYWRVRCQHRDPKEDGRSFCNNEPLADEVRNRSNVKENPKKEPEKPEQPEPPLEVKKAA